MKGNTITNGSPGDIVKDFSLTKPTRPIGSLCLSVSTTPGTNNVQTGYNNLVGNYVWLRAIVNNWTQGPISLISASY